MANRYVVIKRITNEYEVEVEADSPEEAVKKASAGDHGPGELTSYFSDGEDVTPSQWKVFENVGFGTVSDEKPLEFDREELRYLDK